MNDLYPPDPAAERQSALPKKPRSPKQIAASLANGKKSTGPKTPAGLLKCSLAATSQFKHQQLAASVVLTVESRTTFITLLKNYIDAFRPMNEPEHDAIRRMVVAAWHNLRNWSIDQTIFNSEIARQDPGLAENMKSAQAANTLGKRKHNNLYDRQYRQALGDLVTLRKLRPVDAGLDHIPAPVASTVFNHPDIPELPLDE